MKTLSRDAVQRMVGGGAGSGGAGGAGGEDGLSAAWVGNNYVGKDYFSQIFEVRGTKTTTVGSGTSTVESHIFAPNELPSIQSSTEGGVTTTIVTVITDIRVKGGLWTNSYVSALGRNSEGGGGGATALTDLVDVAVSSPTNGQVLMYNASTGKWYNGTVQSGGGGTVTSITAGTGLSGGTITSSGTIALSQETQTNIGKGVTAYGWGDHSQAGYLTSSALTGYATQQWVQQQGYLTASAISDMATKTWVGQQGYLTSSALTGYATQQWVGQQGFLTTETDPTVPSWAKASSKPSYSFSEITGSIAANQLPTLYWANVQVSSSSDDNTSPQFGSVRLKPGSANYGGTLYFGDNSYLYLTEDSDDHLAIYARKGINMSFLSGYGLTVSGDVTAGKVKLSDHLIMHTGYTGIYLNSTGTEIDWHNAQDAYVATLMTFAADSVTANQGLTIPSGKKLSIGGFEIEYDSTNQALKFNGSIYATGGVSALGVGSGGGSIQNMTMTGTLKFSVNGMDSTIYADNDGYLHIEGNEGVIMGNDLHMDGYMLYTDNGSINAGTGSVTAGKFYLDTDRYIFLDGTTLKYNDNGTVKTIVLS